MRHAAAVFLISTGCCLLNIFFHSNNAVFINLALKNANLGIEG
jgi:hypothetical protein